MKDLKLAIGLFICATTTLAQSEKNVDSKITEVTVFLNQAQITREVKTSIAPGRSELVITGLSSQLDQGSIQVSGKGGFTIMGIAHRQNYLAYQRVPTSLQLLKDSLTFLQKQIAMENFRKEILNKEEIMLQNNQKIGGSNQNLTVAEIKAMSDFYREPLTEILIGKMKIEERIDKSNGIITKLQQNIDDRISHYAANTSEIIVSILAETATSVDLHIQYLVANAGWIPVYDLRARNTKSPIILSYKANVFQATGEAWANVKLKLSTVNPNLGGVMPELSAWLLDFDQSEYKKAKWNIAGLASMAIDEDKLQHESIAADTAMTISQFTTTIQTSLNTEFDIAIPYNVASGNKPTLVEIRNDELAADYRYAGSPKLDHDAFLMATITGWEDLSLLPGEANIFFEGTFVAKGYIDPQSINDTLSVSLGRDKRIIVKREKLQEFSSRKFIGMNQRVSYAYEITVRNTKSESVKIRIEDQVPVSQHSEIEVNVSDTGGAQYFEETGKLAWSFSLAPGETKKITFRFDVKYPKDRIVSALYQ